MKLCSVCSSTNVRRSGVHVSEARAHPFQSPYRCLDCGARFWVVSRRTRLGAFAGGTVALTLATFLLVPVLWRHPLPAAKDTRPAANMSMPRGAAPASAEGRTIDDIMKAQTEVLTQRFDQTRQQTR